MEAIGGYFSLELPLREEYHKVAIRLNTGRNCLEYILRARGYKKMYVPYYTCEAVMEPINKLGIPFEYYHIDIHFEICDRLSLQDDEALLYTNYFGLKQRYVEQLAEQFGSRLIVDNTQAFYAKPIQGIDTFYTCRKFFGVADGAYLYTDKLLDDEFVQDESFYRMAHLLKRIDLSAEQGFVDFRRADDGLDNQPIRRMSKLTHRIMQSIDYQDVEKKRRGNYQFLHEVLGGVNDLKLTLGEDDVPMVYPFLSHIKGLRDNLINNRIFIARYWPNVLEWTTGNELEHLLASQMLPLPVDQRYDKKDMEFINETINLKIKKMKKIIIFGATGNVGSYVLKYASEYFDKNEYEVIASGRRETNFFDSMGIRYFSVDLSKKEDFAKLPKEDVYAVIYLAAQIPSYMKGYQPEKYIQSNIMGAYNVLEYCREVHADRILFSTTVFDVSLSATDGNVLMPDTPLNFSYKGDHAVYVISKNTAIELIKHYYAEYGLKYFIFRFPTIYNYSPYHYYHPNGVKTLRPVYRMIDLAMKGEPIELWGDPNYSKDMVHVYDCAQMICKAVEANRETGFYNVGTGIPVTLKQQIEAIIKVFSPKDHPSQIIYRPEKPCGGGFLMNVDNAKKELGYEPKYDVVALFENYKDEMKIDRFKALRIPNESIDDSQMGGGVISQ